MKTKLLEYFGDKIIITDINGKSNVVTFKTTATQSCKSFTSSILEHQDDSDTEKGSSSKKWT